MLGARAFAYGSHVFLGAGERPTDLGVVAHEVAHVVQQQGAGPRVQLFSGGSSPLEVEAHAASAAVVQQRPFAVEGRTQPRVQRLSIIQKARDFFADKAAYIPGFTMLTVIIGMNPISGAAVERSPANILRGAIQIIPGGALITQALDNYGIVDKVANWVAQQIATLGVTAGMFIDAIKEFLGSLSLSDAFHLGDVWERAKRIFSAPIDKLLSFIKSLVDGIIKFIKDAILKPLAKLAEGTRAWDLLIAVLGTNPITGDPVPRTAETLIGGFMKLIGQEDIWQNMQRANAIPRAWAWFQGAIAALMGFVGRIPGLFISTLKSLELVDIILVPRAFIKVGKVFVGFVGEFIGWGLNAAWKLLEIIFDVVSPGAFGYVKRTGAALKSILKNPLPFVSNLGKAAKLGFQNFAGNFLTHLKAGLIDWLTGSLPGIYIPKGFSLAEIAKFVFSILGLTWENIRAKLVKATSEPIVKAMETGFEIVVAFVKGGVAAVWEKIKEQLSNLKDMAIGAITDFVVDLVVKKAIPKLVSMFIPGAGFISAILSIYDMIMVFVQKIRTIIQVVTGFIDSIVAIAGGAIGAAASKVEGILARLLSLAISFLAGFVGLGKVADKIMGIIAKIRAPIDKAIDWLIGWIVGAARRLGRFIAQAGVPQDPNERLRLASAAAVAAARRLRGPVSGGILRPLLGGIQTRYGLKELTPYEERGTWFVRAAINPIIVTSLGVYSSTRQAEGANYQPIIAKLTQAVQMFTIWAGRGSSPVAQQMLRQLETAREQAQALGEAQSRGVFPSELEPRKQALITLLRGVQNLDPRYALISIAELSVAVNNARRQMPAVPVPPWNMLNPGLRAEYVRQLRDQQDGINAMLADQWEQNRARYATAGRSAAGTQMQRTFQTRSGNVPSTAAPHNPDQSPGGFPDPTGPPAALDVNNHIGSQWPSRVGTITTAVNAVPAAERVVTQMNVRLSV